MKNPNIGITSQHLTAVAGILNALLADEFVLYVKTRNYHWNVTGPHFHDLHKFFEAQYEALDDVIDNVAERARALGAVAAGSLAEFAKLTRLKEKPASLIDEKNMIQDLLDGHETIARSLRENLEDCMNKYKDVGTSDFLTGLMEQHEKMAWMLRSMVRE